MDCEFQSLYNAIQTHKNSLTQVLDKIDQNLLEAFNKWNVADLFRKKRLLSMQLAEILPNYVKLLYLSETMLEKLVESINEIDTFPVDLSKPNLNTICELKDKCFDFKELETDLLVKLPEPEPAESNLNDSKGISKAENIPASEKLENMVLPELPSKPPRRVSFKLNNEEDVEEGTAVTKLKQKPILDRQEEIYKSFLNKDLFHSLEWRKISVKNELRGNDKKNRLKNPIFNIPQDELLVNSVYTFCLILSPSSFYVRRNQELLEKLEETLNEEMNDEKFVVNNFKTKEEAYDFLGNFGVAYFLNKRMWYRVEIIDWLVNVKKLIREHLEVNEEDPEKVCIQLIDYGNKLQCDFTNIKPLNEFFSEIPKMAIWCSLAHIYPFEGRSKWPKQTRKAFGELIEFGRKQIEFSVVFAHRENDMYSVDLRRVDDPDGLTLGEILVEKKYAAQVVIKPDVEIDELEEMNINEVITGYDAKDEARICPFSNDSKSCFKGPACKLEHGELSKDGITTDKILTMVQPLVEMHLPLHGETFDILITGYISTCHFYAHILTNRSDGNLYNDNYLQLETNMQAKNFVSTYERFKLLPSLSELVLVQENNLWLRGSCTGFSGDDDIEIFLVDFGYKVLRKLQDLRQFKEEFLHVPAQAVECFLENCQEKKETTKEMSKDFFDRAMYRQVFQAVIVVSAKPLIVQLWDSHNMDMSHVLKQMSLGEDQTFNLYPPEGYILSCG